MDLLVNIWCNVNVIHLLLLLVSHEVYPLGLACWYISVRQQVFIALQFLFWLLLLGKFDCGIKKFVYQKFQAVSE